MAAPIPAQQTLLEQALTDLSLRPRPAIRSIRPAPGVHRGAWLVRISSAQRATCDQERALLALFLSRSASDIDPGARYERAALAGLPAPSILARAENDDQVLLLCAMPSGEPLVNMLRAERAPWEISSAAVSLARFLARVHRTSPEELGLTSNEPVAAWSSERALEEIRSSLSAFPLPLRSTLSQALDWIDANLDHGAVAVPTFGALSMAGLFAVAGEIEVALGWESLTLAPAGHDIATLLQAMQPIEVTIRQQFVAVTVASYLQTTRSQLPDLPALALLAFLERATMAWSARSSNASAALSDVSAADMADRVERALQASRGGLTTAARHDFTL